MRPLRGLKCSCNVTQAFMQHKVNSAKLRTHELGEKMFEGVVRERKTQNTHLVAIYTIKFIVINFQPEGKHQCAAYPLGRAVAMLRKGTARRGTDVCSFSFSLKQCLLPRTVGLRVGETTEKSEDAATNHCPKMTWGQRYSSMIYSLPCFQRSGGSIRTQLKKPEE